MTVADAVVLKKKILPEGVYLVRSGSERVRKEFSAQYLRRIASNTNRMIESGLKIPAPFGHHKDARPSEAELSVNEPSNPYNNAGYWKRFWVEEENGKAILCGELETYGGKDDPNTPLYKLLRTATETSVSIADNFHDGHERVWNDCVLHVAVVNHPVVPAQENFEMGTIVNMSMMDGDTQGILDELRTELRSVGIELPPSSSVEVFLRDLLVAVKQHKSGHEEPIKPVPIYMSLGDDQMLSLDQAKAIVESGAINPGTGKPFTMEDLGFVKKEESKEEKKSVDMSAIEEKERRIEALAGLANALKNKIVEDTKNNILSRINRLVANGIVSSEFAEKKLKSQLDYELSIVGGKIADHPLEVTLSALESISPKKDSDDVDRLPGEVEEWDLSVSDPVDSDIDGTVEELLKRNPIL